MASPLPALIADLVAAFPLAFPNGMPRESMVAYCNGLADLPPDRVAEAVVVAVRTMSRPPTVGQLREIVAERESGLPSYAQALAQVDAYTSWLRLPEGERGSRPALHPAVRAALVQVGGFGAWREADRPSVLRAQFRDVYRDAREDAIRKAQEGDAHVALGPGRERKELGW